jgi:hypothetical protein
MALTVTAISPAAVPENGGFLVQISGTFVLDHAHRVFIGEKNTILDHACLSAVPEQGITIYPYSTTLIKAYTPLLLPGGPYNVTVRDMVTMELAHWVLALTVTYQQLYSTVFRLRQPFPPFYRTGPRQIDLVEPI